MLWERGWKAAPLRMCLLSCYPLYVSPSSHSPTISLLIFSVLTSRRFCPPTRSISPTTRRSSSCYGIACRRTRCGISCKYVFPQGYQLHQLTTILVSKMLSDAPACDLLDLEDYLTIPVHRLLALYNSLHVCHLPIDFFLRDSHSQFFVEIG